MTRSATSCLRNGPEAIGSTWPDFWATIKSSLREKGYRQSTLILYRQVLRTLAKQSLTAPHNISRRHITDYLYSLANRRVSASWLAMNISVLRTCFDKTFGTHLSVRTIDRIVRTTAQFANILKPVTAMTLRHSFAVHQLQAGINIREIQQHLGLQSLETMMRYLDCIPEPIPSPFDSFTVPLIPDLPTEDIQLPFPQTSPTRYFYRWMTTKLRNGFRLFRSSA